MDHEGEILEGYVSEARDKKAALAFLKKAFKHHGSPETITTDGLRSYKAAMTKIGNADKQETGRTGSRTATYRSREGNGLCSGFDR